MGALIVLAGGGGITKSKEPDMEELFDKVKLRGITEKCMKIVQSLKI